jgi:hypothetical protein|tara:strand:+ start:1044 stop:1370 length:327 start_codon:yes stop_codon:yes gene_type:complete
MANGILGSSDLLATTNTTVYDVPDSTFSIATVSFCNKNATAITVRLALVKPGQSTPGPDDYIEYGTEVLANGVLERTGIVLEADRKVVAYSSTANTVVMVFGIETATV